MEQREQRERKEQEMLVKWFYCQYPNEVLVVSANGGSRHLLEAINLRRSGVRRGIPDLFLPVPNATAYGLWIEFKPTHISGTKKAQPTKEQLVILEYLRGKGFIAMVCWGFEEAANAIRNYMLLE